MATNTEVDTYTLANEQIVGDTARVLVVPLPDVTDPAFLFARKGTDGWEAISIGTWFPPRVLSEREHSCRTVGAVKS